MRRYSRSQRAIWFGSPLGVVALTALTALTIYLLTEHTSHVLALLPFGIILACPLMHIFMHGGHGGHGQHDGHDDGPTQP